MTTNHNGMGRFGERSARFCALAFAPFLLFACGADPAGDATDAGPPDDAVDDTQGDATVDADVGADVATLACLDSSGCNAEPGFEGTVCMDGACVDCVDDATCAADYGDGSACVDGRCTAGCPVGTPGCACDEGACADSFCIDEACVDCAPGAVGCVCGDDATCDAGARCDDALCVACPVGEVGCACGDDEVCDAGLRCGDADLCEACPAGALGCACGGDDGDTCDDGLVCMMDLCVTDTCVPGAVDCPCDGDACDDGLYCADDLRCRGCDANAVGCACDVDEGCTNDLVCDADDAACRVERTCEDDGDTLGCLPRQLCDDGDDGEDAFCAEACEPGFRWTGTRCEIVTTATCAPGTEDSITERCAAENRACDDDEAGATCGACLDGFTESGGPACRAVETCATLAAACDADGRDCIDGEGPSDDAVCAPCEAPFVEPDAGTACVLPDDASCDPEAERSIAELCEGQSRVCVDGGADTGANCGSCLAGFAEDDAGDCLEASSCVELGCERLGRRCEGALPFETCGDCRAGLSPSDPEDPLSECRARVSCDDLTCEDDAFCVEGEFGGDARCVVPDCEAGDATDPSTGRCVTCGLSAADCDEEGQTGRLWPVTRPGGECVCETVEGYYLDTSSALIPRACDADGDGWVVTGAEPFVNHPEGAVRSNARCDVRVVDRIVLQNDLLQRREILLCTEGDIVAGDGECDPEPLALYEPAVLDDDEAIVEEAGFFPRYGAPGGDGRGLTADELNPFTRACVNGRGDFNANGLPDLQEAHGTDVAGLGLDARERAVFDYTYLVELHRGWVETRPASTWDAWVIAERPRCTEADGDLRVAARYADGGFYYRECVRGRPADFDASVPQHGYDFARWSCDAELGTCPNPGPLTTTIPGLSDPVPSHSSCDVALPPADGAWRGMSHHSQYRCVEVDDDGAVEPWQLAPSETWDVAAERGGVWQFNACHATGAVAPAEAPGPATPALSCDPVTPGAGAVGLVAARYQDGPGWQTGCLDESDAYPELCPGYVLDPFATVRDGLSGDFGRLVCGCGRNFGGEGCRTGCPSAMTSDEYGERPGVGWWMCGTPASTAMDADAPDGAAVPGFTGTYDGSAWSVRGRIAASPRDRAPMTATDDGDRTWSVR